VRSVPSPKRVAKTGLAGESDPSACEPGTVVAAICVATCIGMVPAEQVVRAASCPVLTIRGPGEEGRGS